MTWHQAPGKLILSGEHAVIYKQPALAVAVNKFVKTRLQPQNNATISFYSHDLDTQKHYSLLELFAKYQSIKQKYNEFSQHNLPISAVLCDDLDLIIYTTGHLLNNFNLNIKTGFSLYINSNIPIGCGMGSSAAIILSIIRSLINHYQLSISTEELLKLAKNIEHLCHGQSSGFDLRTIHRGGCLLLNTQQGSTSNINSSNFSIVNTGKPKSSTGSCVSHVRQAMQNNMLLSKFKKTTLSLYNNLQQNNELEVHKLIRTNHRLLVRIGVVPKKIQDFITQIENTGASAKICGAGSVEGDNAGYCIIFGQTPSTHRFIKTTKYQIEPLTIFNH